MYQILLDAISVRNFSMLLENVRTTLCMIDAEKLAIKTTHAIHLSNSFYKREYDCQQSFFLKLERTLREGDG